MQLIIGIVVIFLLGAQLALAAALLRWIRRGSQHAALGIVAVLVALSFCDGASLVRWLCLGVHGFKEYVDEDIALPFLGIAWITAIAAGVLGRRLGRHITRALAVGAALALLVSSWQGRYTASAYMAAQKRPAPTRLLVPTLFTSDFNVYGPISERERRTQRDYLNPSFLELVAGNGWAGVIDAVAKLPGDTNVEHVEKAMAIAEKTGDWATYLSLVRALSARSSPNRNLWMEAARAPLDRGSEEAFVAIYREALAASPLGEAELRFEFLDLALDAPETGYLDRLLSVDAKPWQDQTSRSRVWGALFDKTLDREFLHGATQEDRRLFRERVESLLSHGFDAKADAPLVSFCRNHVATREAERTLGDERIMRRAQHRGWDQQKRREAARTVERVKHGMEVVLPVLLEIAPADREAAYELCAASAPSLREMDEVRALSAR